MTLFLNPRDVFIIKDKNGNKLSPRGRLVDTGKLENSIREQGQIVPIIVTWRDGGWALLEGENRLFVCRKLGLTVIANEHKHEAHGEMSDAAVIKFMLASNIHEPFPLLTLDNEGNIVAGIAMAVIQLKASGVKALHMPNIVGVKYNVVLGLEALEAAHVDVRKAVAAETLGLSNVSLLLKAFEPEKQQCILEYARNRGALQPYSRDNLRKAIEWLQDNEWGENEEPTPDSPDTPADHDEESLDLPDSARDVLDDARMNLNKAVIMGLDPMSLVTLELIRDMAQTAIDTMKI